MIKNLIFALLSASLIFSTLVEFLSPSQKGAEVVEIVEPTLEDDIMEAGNFYDQLNMDNVENWEDIEKQSENDEFQIWLPKIIDILKNSDIGFVIFYFLIFLTLFLQLLYFLGNSEISFLAVDFNLQAPPMLGVGGTIYALVNSDISGSTSIVQTLTAILLGAGLTTLLGIFVFIINHFLTRYIKTK